MKMITTTVLKPHLNPATGKVVQVGDTIELEEQRHKALSSKGYVSGGESERDAVEQSGPASEPALTNARVGARRMKISGAQTPSQAKAKPTGKGRTKAAGKGK